jgi:hypothetical protein
VSRPCLPLLLDPEPRFATPCIAALRNAHHCPRARPAGPFAPTLRGASLRDASPRQTTPTTARGLVPRDLSLRRFAVLRIATPSSALPAGSSPAGPLLPVEPMLRGARPRRAKLTTARGFVPRDLSLPGNAYPRIALRCHPLPAGSPRGTSPSPATHPMASRGLASRAHALLRHAGQATARGLAPRDLPLATLRLEPCGVAMRAAALPCGPLPGMSKPCAASPSSPLPAGSPRGTFPAPHHELHRQRPLPRHVGLS